MKLVIGHLYPDLLNLYGDRGNIQCMQQRLKWRGIDSEVIRYEAGMKIDFDHLDIILLGGGSDREQRMVCEYLREIKDDFKDYVEQGKVVLAVCGGYQLLGHHYETKHVLIEGLSILDIETRQGEDRLIDNVILDSPLAKLPVVGFENHGGRTDIGSHIPFGKVLFGHGNNGLSGYEGVIYKHVIGTYIHGPLLPKNPEICDWLLEKALQQKYGDVILEALPDEEEKRANQRLVQRLLKEV